MPEMTTTKQTMTAKGGTVFHVTIQRPVLTPDEYERRLNRVKRATVELLKAQHAAHAAKEGA